MLVELLVKEEEMNFLKSAITEFDQDDIEIIHIKDCDIFPGKKQVILKLTYAFALFHLGEAKKELEIIHSHPTPTKL